MDAKNGEGREKLRYFVGKGNNSRLILSQFKQRKRWIPAARQSEVANLNNGRGLKKASDVRSNLWWCRYGSSLGYNHLAPPKVISRGFQPTKKKGENRRMLVNHFEGNRCLVSKCGLYETVSPLESDSNISCFPKTFILKAHGEKDLRSNDLVGGQADFSTSELEEYLTNECTEFGVWILKPGHNSNRGCDITVANTIADLKKGINVLREKKKYKTLIVQKYIEKPLLLKQGRKFDIRAFVLLTFDERKREFQGWLHRNAYLRMSSKIFNLKLLNDKGIHLTNDAVQNRLSSYGKYEDGNKLSLEEFAHAIDENYSQYNGEDTVNEKIWPGIKRIVKLTMQAAIPKLLSKARKGLDCFELFGYDFMVDKNLKLSLIEVNENPCLEQSSPLLEKYIPEVINDTFNIVIDGTYFPVKEIADERTRCQQSHQYEHILTFTE